MIRKPKCFKWAEIENLENSINEDSLTENIKNNRRRVNEAISQLADTNIYFHLKRLLLKRKERRSL